VKRICYPCNGFIKSGKIMARSSQDFCVEFCGDKSHVHVACLNDLEFFLFGTGRDVGTFRFTLSGWRMLPFLTVHFYCLGVGGKASISNDVVTYEF